MNRTLHLQRKVALLVAMMVVALPLFGFPATQKRAVHTQIMAIEEQWRQALLSGDVAAMDKLLSDDYLGVSVSGMPVTKTQELDRMRARKVILSGLNLTDIRIKMLGRSVAVVNSLAAIEGSNEGHPIKGSFRYTHVYQRLPSGVWKLTSFEPTRIRQHPNSNHGSGSNPATSPERVPNNEPGY